MSSTRDKTQPDAFEALLEFTTDFIMVADARGCPLVWNRAYARIIREALGVEMVAGARPHDQQPDPAARAYWDELHARVLAGEQLSVEVAQPFPDGEVRHFGFTFCPVVEEGAVVGFCEISREITGRVRGEEALRESERVLRESQEVARVGSYRLDIATGRWQSSAILDAIFGIGREHPHSVESWVAVLHPDHREAMERYFADEVVGQRQPFDREYMIVRANDGATRWVHGRGRLELGPDGAPVAMLGTIRDVTERKEMEQRLRQQEKLEAIGQLAGGVAHDFNNQLVAILGFAELLRARVDGDPDLTLYVDNILQCAKRAADLTGQLLAFSRKGKVLNVAVDLGQVVSEVVGVLRHTVDKRIAITQRIDGGPTYTVGDPSQLQSAVLNLALNARDAMPSGGEITLASEVVALDAAACARLPANLEPGPYVRVSVQDTGMGIARDVLSHIFEPFFTTKAAGQGTGMGLAAVYGTVKTHRGAIDVASEPGKGSTFRLYLPLASGVEAAPSAPQSQPQAARRTLRVLLADDEESVRSAMVAMLEISGFQVTACADGAEAVARFRERAGAYDVVILDLIMPVLGGREALAAIRELDPRARVILASGYGLDDETQGLVEQGVGAVLQKPFRLDELLETIASLVPNGARTQPVASRDA